MSDFDELSVDAKEIGSGMRLAAFDDLIDQADRLQRPQCLLIEIDGARLVVDLRVHLGDRDGMPVLAEQIGERGADGAAADDQNIVKIAPSGHESPRTRSMIAVASVTRSPCQAMC